MAAILGHGQPPAPAQVRRVVWTDEAVSNLDSIAGYITDFSPMAAQRLALRLRKAAESLAASPERGRPVARDIRELTVIYPYLIRYRERDDDVLILRIRHGARRQ